ncbi:30S ribosomal protein S31, chloroplastic [Quillaja saponaria]|uniref:30S ribosomal protein S31, chloroplastic n=1 Tax=Quillaja saponaria TaxID=32244 RepID=A0AAD7LPR9_QUISA|nr:30S ribosomal protein S31, chloroplastic [Quillaja saponaria]
MWIVFLICQLLFKKKKKAKEKEIKTRPYPVNVIPPGSYFLAMASSLVLVRAPPLSFPLQNPSSRISFSQSETLCSPISAPTASLSISAATSPSSIPSVYCGRGDKKTARGKRFNHSFGNARPRDKNKGRGPPRVTAPPAPPKKDRFDTDEIVKIEIDESLF